MKRLCVLLMAACAGLGAYEHRVIARIGASHVYRGYSSWVEIMHYWSPDVFTFTADAGTDTITAVGHNLTSSQRVMLTTSGTLPGGVNAKREYQVCNISGDTFQFVLYGYGDCSNVGNPAYRVDITDAGTGTHRLGIAMSNGPYPGNYHIYLTLSGVPSGVTYEVWCESSLCPVEGGKYKSSWGSAFFLIRFTASKTATLGAVTVTATISTHVDMGEPDEAIDLPLTVEDLTPIPSVRPASYPALPNLATWGSSVYAVSLKWCDPTSYATAASSIGSLAYGVETGIWFYDGTWTFRQVARYLNDPSWNNCADYINDWYRNYTLTQNGGHTGYKAFTAGLKSSCASCDMRNRYAITRMASAQAMGGTAGWPWDFYIRETAYYLETLISYEQVTGVRHTRLVRGAENLLSMFDELFRDGTWTYQQTYWDGLAMRALIQYFELTGDQRVPAYVKLALDWLWTHAWNDTTKKLVYNPENKGPRCSAGCANLDGWDWTELIGLIVPASGWYYWYSGDDTYRQRGDEWFKALPRWPQFTATASNDRVVIEAHGLSVDDQVNVRALRGQSLPVGLVSNGNYYVKSVIDANTFTLSAAKGGATVNITSDGTGFMGLKCNNATCRGLYSGKMYNQQLRWAFAYVQWRQGQTPYAP